MKPYSPRHAALFAGTVLITGVVPLGAADDSVVTPVLDITTGLAGVQARVTWPAQPGIRYRVEKFSALTPGDPGRWLTRELVESPGNAGAWVDPEPQSQRAFYRVPSPQPEVFSVYPAVFGPAGGTLTLDAQCLPAGSSLVLEIDGQAPVVVPLTPGPDGTYRGALAPGAIAGIAIGVVVARVTGPGGDTLATIGQTLEITDTGLASDFPPSAPPAVAITKTTLKAVLGRKLAARIAGTPDEGREGDAPGLEFTSAPPRSAGFELFFDGYEEAALMKAKEKANRTKCGNNLRQLSSQPKIVENKESRLVWSRLPGEVAYEHCDLALGTPAGPDIVWARTYRSKGGGAGGGAGGGIDCGTSCFSSYDIRIEPVPLAAGTSAPQLHLFTGDGRRDVLSRQPDGSYRCDGMFREGSFNADTSFTLTFADKSQFIFCPLVGAPWQGRIGSILDSNGVGLTCTYTPAGQLATVSSQFGQSLAVAYGPTGAVASVSDHTGRSVSYSYYGAGEPGGSAGDLKSVSCPALPGQPPLAGPTTFAYTTGHPDDRLNHNLLSITDGAGRLLEAYTYSSTTDPRSIEFDTCATVDSHRAPALPGHVTVLKFSALPPGGGGSYRCTVNDELGRVTEYDFDAHHRCVACREYTGFAIPDVAVTSSTNRPQNKLRPGDPEFYLTTFRYNPDHGVTRVTHPDGSQVRTTFGRELRQGCPVRERGNAHLITLVSPGGERRTLTCDYLPGFGTGEEMRSRHMTLKGQKIMQNFPVGDDAGTELIIAWLSKRGYDYYKASSDLALPGYLSKRGYDYYKARSDLVSAGRHSNPYFHENPLQGEIVQARAGGGRKGWDGTIKGMSSSAHCVRLTTSHGQVFTWDYDLHGNCTSSRTPVAGAGGEATYDAQGRCTSVTALNGPASSFRCEFTYHAGTGFCASVINDSAPGGLRLTTLLERDALGRITRCVDPRGFDCLTEYDALDRITVERTPAVGTGPAPARLSTRFFYDAGGRCAGCEIEHREATGEIEPANPAYTAYLIHDSRGRLARIAVEQRPASPPALVTPAIDTPVIDPALFAVTDFTRDAAGQCVRVSIPALSRGQSTDAVCDYQFDERGLLYRAVSGGLGALGVPAVQCDYDAFGAPVACSLLPSSALPGLAPITTSFTYDGFHRLASCADPMGNVTAYEYDEQGFITVSVYGEEQDEPGSAGNVLLSRSRGSAGDFSSLLSRNAAPTDDGGLATGRRKGKVEMQWKVEEGEKALRHPDDQEPDPLFGARKGNVEMQWKVEEGEKSVRRPDSPFFAVYTSDLTISTERFTAGTPAPHATETTLIQRSPAGLVRSIQTNGDVRATYTYDSAGRCTGFTNAACSVALTLDAGGRTLACGRTDHFRTGGTPGKSFTRTWSYDALGRPTSTADRGGNTESRHYDSLGRVTRFTNARGIAYRARWDSQYSHPGSPDLHDFTCLIECDTDGDGDFEMLRHSLCWSGECRSTTNSNQHTTRYAYDAAGRLERCDHPDGTEESRAFDAYGRHISTVHQDGTVVDTSLDGNGRVSTTTYSGGAPGALPVPVTTLVHDGLDRLARCDQGDSHLSFGWDSCDNPVSESHNGSVIARTFDHRGRTSLTYPDGTRFAEQRDAFGLVTSVTPVAKPPVVLPPVTIVEHLGLRPWRESRANGVVTTYEYRADGEPPQAGGAEDFSFDACVRVHCIHNGNPISIHLLRRNQNQHLTQSDTLFSGDADAAGRRQSYTLDRLDRITRCLTRRREVAGGPQSVESDVTYTLDLENRRLSAAGGANPGNYAQSAALPPGDHQMSQYTTWPGGPLEWDAQGCLTSLSRTTVSLQCLYDAASRLVAVTNATTGQLIATYAYDALGRRARSTTAGTPVVPPATTFFVYDGDVCVQELDEDGLPTFTVGAATIGPCISTRNGTVIYPHGGGTTSGALGARGGKEVDKLKEEVKKLTARTFTGSTGTVLERLDCDDAGFPLFLTGDGLPRPGASDTLSGFRWMAPECIWCPESQFLQGADGVYAPEIGAGASSHKEKPKPKPKPTSTRPSNAGWDLATNKKV